MIFHPNPMIEYKTGIWEDTHLKKVTVRPIVVNNSKNKYRWVVFEKSLRSGGSERISQHITEEQAVVSAQRLANRLYLQKLRGHKKKNKKLVSTPVRSLKDLPEIFGLLEKAVEFEVAGQPDDARKNAREVFDFLQHHFDLR